MRKIETAGVSRADLVKRYAELQKQASEDPKSIDSMTDSFEGKEDIAPLIERIMRAMDAQDGVGKYRTKKAALLKAATAALLVQAMDELAEAPAEGGDLADPVMHQIHDTEQLVDTLHEPKLDEEVEQLEHDAQEGLEHAPGEEQPMEHKFASLQAKIAKEEAKVNAMKRVAELMNSPKMAREEKAALLEAFASLLKSASEEDEKFEGQEDGDKKEHHDVPEIFQSSEPGDEEPAHEKEADDKKEASAELTTLHKQAILNARLAFLKRQANVDGKSMATPKEVPSAEGTTEDNLKGDAKIQYQTALPEDAALDEIVERRQKIQRSVGGAGEANTLYFGDTPESHYEVQHTTDSAKGVNNKRSLKDMGTAVQPDHPVTPKDAQESGAGNLQKEKSWEQAKSESDTTPTGGRLKGLAELMKERTDRAYRLASVMHQKGMIKTEDDHRNRIVEFASMDDEDFNRIAAFVDSTPDATPAPIVAEARQERTAAVRPQQTRGSFKKTASAEADEEDEQSDEDSMREAIARRAEGMGRSAGLNRPLNFGLKEAAIGGGGSDLRDALANIGWDDPLTRVASMNAAQLDMPMQNPSAYLAAEAARANLEGYSNRRIG